MKETNLNMLLKALGRQCGTIHQVAEEVSARPKYRYFPGYSASQLLDAPSFEIACICYLLKLPESQPKGK